MKEDLFFDASWGEHPFSVVVLAVSWWLVGDDFPRDVLSLESGFQEVGELGLDEEHFDALFCLRVGCLKEDCG